MEEHQLYWKSTGKAGKKMPDGSSTEGKWFPFEALMKTSETDNYFLKGKDVENLLW